MNSLVSKDKPQHHFAAMRIDDLFKVQSGDFHAVKELDDGNIPLISCGNTNNGLIGYFDIPEAKVYHRAITVAYNGQPLTTKFHSYRFGAKDDVAVLVPKKVMYDTTLLYIAALLNKNQWRYSYGRKCFREKLRNFELPIPVTLLNAKTEVDEEFISKLFPRTYKEFIPSKLSSGIFAVPQINWQSFNIVEILHLKRGDFHSIADLDPGEYMTVSRVSDDNGVVGYYKQPDKAKIYSRGHITVSTVGGDAFVQLDEFLATDNVIVCTPKTKLRITTIFFISFMLNYQKWRYSYGRQCYQAKLEKVNIYLPVKDNGDMDEDVIEIIVKQASYWPYVQRQFADMLYFGKSSEGSLWENINNNDEVSKGIGQFL